MSITRRIAILLALLWLRPAPSAAQDKRPSVLVTFEIEARRYRSRFGPSEAAAIEARAAGILARRLAENIGFLRFDSAGTAPYRLEFHLANRDPKDVASAGEVGLTVTLKGTRTPLPLYYWHPFRGAEHADHPVGTASSLIAQVGLRVPTTARSYDLLTHRLLKEIPIADSARIKPTIARSGWILPYLHGELCMVELGSWFTVDSDIDESNVLRTERTVGSGNHRLKAPESGERRGSIVVVPSDSARTLLNALRLGKVQPRAAYVERYTRGAQCAGLVPASGRSR